MTDADDKTQPIRELLGALAGAPQPRPTKCGGASVPVTRTTFKTTERILDVDLMCPPVLPEGDARFDARVFCTADAQAGAGICEKCHRLEAKMRGLLAEAKARQP